MFDAQLIVRCRLHSHSAVDDSYYTGGESGGWETGRPPRLRKQSLTGVEALHSHDIKTSKFMHPASAQPQLSLRINGVL